MRSILLSCVFAAALFEASPALAQSPPQAPAPTVTEHPVDGTTIRRMTAATVIRAPFEAVSARLLDYGRYPDFLRRFRSARVVHRNRADTDVYFQLELPRAMGTVWFVHRMTVVRRSPQRLEILGLARSGNAGRVETRIVIERLAEAQPSTHITFELFGVPVVPALPDTVNDSLRAAVRSATELLRGRVEGGA